MNLIKIIEDYKYSSKRELNLVTPCCNKSNNDGKFSSFANVPVIYGYCHSCGIATLPPQLYQDEKGNQYSWNEFSKKFESAEIMVQNQSFAVAKGSIAKPTAKLQNYIPEEVLWEHYYIQPENKLLKYLRAKYGNAKVDDAKEVYGIGSTPDGGTIFWNINSELQIQKAKVCYYDANGKRTNKFKVPYKNEDGYHSCLFGEHLIYDKFKGVDKVVLVESEKTAIVGHINLPQYNWIAYGGINGLTNGKLQCLIGHKVVIIPDMSENAASIMYDKIPYMRKLGINASIWDMTDDKSDDQLRLEGLYNYDLEDVFRKIMH
ncbi:DUF6371 domain-containing protein [Flavobacterium tegetincola]|uniref:DUF6371 domain-containing protein n=1 Tax=Flavobacterium tegetincola TaxID=150172 RepID=UPI00040F0EFD|nr:DUF6371 domain-containing protein [Flavobacterium tegetincola]